MLPVVLGVAIGGFAVGVGSAVLGFFGYDWFFIPPYGTLSVSSAQYWVALGVYLAVVLVVSRLVAVQQEARRVAADREDAVRQLFVVSEQMIGERSLDELLAFVVTTVHDTFPTTWVAILLPDAGQLHDRRDGGSRRSPTRTVPRRSAPPDRPRRSRSSVRRRR